MAEPSGAAICKWKAEKLLLPAARHTVSPKVYLTVSLAVCIFICSSMQLPGSFIKYLAPGIVHIVKCKYETDVEVVEYICYRVICLCVRV